MDLDLTIKSLLDEGWYLSIDAGGGAYLVTVWTAPQGKEEHQTRVCQSARDSLYDAIRDVAFEMQAHTAKVKQLQEKIIKKD